MAEPVLVIMAAGMGSRYGGLKQIDPVGLHGEKIIDYSLYDARLAGFKRAIFVIKEELLSDFQDSVFAEAGKYMEVDYTFQKMNDVPEGIAIPEGRVKPWGTGHAALCGGRKTNSPYAVINADDFYGREAFQKLYDFLKNAEAGEKLPLAMVGFYLKNTVTENGYVSRGVCETENGKLKAVVERTRIEKREDGIAYTEDDGKTWISLSEDTIVSMNFWGFVPEFTEVLEKDYARFFQEDLPKNPLKGEFFLPFAASDALARGEADISLLSSSDKWYGVTYQEDKATVVDAIRKMTEEGIYPSPLWK